MSSTKGKSFVADYEIYRVWFAFEANAYLIHRNSAKKLLKDTPASILADDYQYMNMKGIAVYGLLPFLSTGLSNDGRFISGTLEKSQERVPGKDILLFISPKDIRMCWPCMRQDSGIQSPYAERH